MFFLEFKIFYKKSIMLICPPYAGGGPACVGARVAQAGHRGAALPKGSGRRGSGAPGSAGPGRVCKGWPRQYGSMGSRANLIQFVSAGCIQGDKDTEGKSAFQNHSAETSGGAKVRAPESVGMLQAAAPRKDGKEPGIMLAGAGCPAAAVSGVDGLACKGGIGCRRGKKGQDGVAPAGGIHCF